MKKGITSGRLFSDSHQTIIRQAVPVLAKLKKSNTVKKIVVGKIKNTRSKVPKLVTEVSHNSIRLTVKSHGEIQEFFLLGSAQGIVKQIKDLTLRG